MNWLWLALILKLLDDATTYTFLQYGGQEGNPIWAYIISKFGVLPGLICNFIYGGAIILWVASLKLRIVMIIVSAIFAAAVLFNMFYILLLLRGSGIL